MPVSIFHPDFAANGGGLFEEPEPFPDLAIVTDDEGAVLELNFLRGGDPRPQPIQPERNAHVERQLEEYFANRRQTFDLALKPKGTEFQRQVWRALTEIPFGETRSYLDVASAIGRPTATRAVGAANGANPIVIVQPCHRVIGSNGTLTGFGGGLSAKAVLLTLEGVPV